MSSQSERNGQSLPQHPNLQHLENQAKDLLRSGSAVSIGAAQLEIAKQYGFPSWSKLKEHVVFPDEAGRLKQAIDRDDVDEVLRLLSGNPSLHHAPIGYAKNGALTWVAECRIPGGPPSSAKLAMAEWMIKNGSDVHQGGDAPLMRAALCGERVPMMELLLRHGANVNAEWNGNYPILFAPCETVDRIAIKWLLEHGAHPNCPKPGRETTALDYLIGSYVRSSELGACIELLKDAGGTSRYDLPGVLETVTDSVGRLAEQLDVHPDLLSRQYAELDFGSTAGRRLLLTGTTLLHVAAEYGSTQAAQLLLTRGADPNAQATVDEAGIGGQTPIFHAVTQVEDRGLAPTQLLLHYGADLRVRAKLPGHYERQNEVLDCTPLGYALRFPGSDFPRSNARTIALLRQRGATE